jgi:hypothetical protein
MLDQESWLEAFRNSTSEKEYENNIRVYKDWCQDVLGRYYEIVPYEYVPCPSLTRNNDKRIADLFHGKGKWEHLQWFIKQPTCWCFFITSMNVNNVKEGFVSYDRLIKQPEKNPVFFENWTNAMLYLQESLNYESV